MHRRQHSQIRTRLGGHSIHLEWGGLARRQSLWPLPHRGVLSVSAGYYKTVRHQKGKRDRHKAYVGNGEPTVVGVELEDLFNKTQFIALTKNEKKLTEGNQAL